MQDARCKIIFSFVPIVVNSLIKTSDLKMRQFENLKTKKSA